MARPGLGLLAATGATAVLTIGLLAGPALAAPDGAATGLAADVAFAADETATTEPDDGTGGSDRLVLRLQRACDRIPNLLTRSARLEDKLAGDAGTRGSIAWLQKKIDRAEAAGKADVVTALEARLKVREDLQKILPARVDQLKQAQSGLCVDVAAAASATS
jgi:hypothetical protein